MHSDKKLLYHISCANCTLSHNYSLLSEPRNVYREEQVAAKHSAEITHHSIYQHFLSANSPHITLLWYFFFSSSSLHSARKHLKGSSLTMRNTYSFHSKLLWFDIYFKMLRCIEGKP